MKPTKEQIAAAAGKTLPDVIAPALDVLFCGINPGLYTAAVGHHFGRPGNRFWPVLHRAGFTPRLFDPSEQRALLPLGCGITNIVARASARADELTTAELVAGAAVLAEKVRTHRPRVVAFLGITAYRTAFQRPEAGLGRQPKPLAGAAVWILPNPSGLNAHYQLPDLARLFAELRQSVGVDVPWLVVFLAIGSVMLWACGMILAAACLNMSRNGMFLSEGIAGVVYLVSGVVFPLSALPSWVKPVSLSLPTTYWLEGMRRALMGPLPEQFRGPLSDWSNGELALMLWLVARHYERTRDLEFVRAVYRRLVVQPAEFMIEFRDPLTRLPKPSFDIWEERQGVFTFTCAAVCAGLHAASELANLFNEQERRTRYARAAAEVRDAIVRHLWLEQEGRFARGLLLRDDDTLEIDPTIDASAFGTFYLDVFPAESAMVEGTMRAIREKLWVPTETGGVARYEHDRYHRTADDDAIPGNPWLICTLWLAEHAVARATSVAELQSALDLVRWARSKARPSLILPEQIDPESGAPLSVAPFTWSHAQVVSVVRGYLEALRFLRRESRETVMRDEEKIARDHPVDKPKWFP